MRKSRLFLQNLLKKQQIALSDRTAEKPIKSALFLTFSTRMDLSIALLKIKAFSSHLTEKL